MSHSDGGGWDIRGDAKTCQTGLREINETIREKARMERDIKNAERQAEMEERKAETARKKAERDAAKEERKADIARKKAERDAEKEEKLAARQAAKEEKLQKLHNEERNTELTIGLETTKSKFANDVTIKGLENEAAGVQLDYDLRKEDLTLKHDFAKEKLSRTADLYDKGMDTIQLKMKQEHDEIMENIKLQKDMMLKGMGGMKSMTFQRRTGSSTFLKALGNESSKAGRNLAITSTSSGLAIDYSGEGALATTDPDCLPAERDGGVNGVDGDTAGQGVLDEWTTEMDNEAYGALEASRMAHTEAMLDRKAAHELEMKKLDLEMMKIESQGKRMPRGDMTD